MGSCSSSPRSVRPGGNLPGEAVIHRGAQGVHVCPGALIPAGVLLPGGKSVFQGNGPRSARSGSPGTAEVHQFHSPIFQLHQVIRADVPVDHSRLVHGTP